MRRARRGSKKGWPVVATRISPKCEELLSQLEAKQRRLRADLVHEAVVALLRSYGYQPEAA